MTSFVFLFEFITEFGWLQYAASSWDELKHIRQAVAFLVCSLLPNCATIFILGFVQQHLDIWHLKCLVFVCCILELIHTNIFDRISFISLDGWQIQQFLLFYLEFVLLSDVKLAHTNTFYCSFQVIFQKFRISYDEIVNDLCPVKPQYC